MKNRKKNSKEKEKKKKDGRKDEKKQNKKKPHSNFNISRVQFFISTNNKNLADDGKDQLTRNVYSASNYQYFFNVYQIVSFLKIFFPSKIGPITFFSPTPSKKNNQENS